MQFVLVKVTRDHCGNHLIRTSGNDLVLVRKLLKTENMIKNGHEVLLVYMETNANVKLEHENTASTV